MLYGIGGLLQLGLEYGCAVKSRQGVYKAPICVKDVVDAVSGDSALQLAAIAEFDRHPWCRTHRLPVQDEALLQQLVDLGVGVKRSAKKTAVGAAQVFIQVSQ